MLMTIEELKNLVNNIPAIYNSHQMSDIFELSTDVTSIPFDIAVLCECFAEDGSYGNILFEQLKIKTLNPNADSFEIVRKCIPKDGTIAELERCSDIAEQFNQSGDLSDRKYQELCERYYQDI